jgi:hypothetical protein
MAQHAIVDPSAFGIEALLDEDYAWAYGRFDGSPSREELMLLQIERFSTASMDT